VGALEVVDIGLVMPDPGSPGYPVELATASAMAELIPERDPRAHKGSAGRVLVVGGSAGLTGAVALAAHAATRAGAGYVQACVPESLNDILEVKLTEEMTIPCPETGGRALSIASLDTLRASAARVHVVALGSGLSRDPEAAELARRFAAGADCPLVIDADALNAFQEHAGSLARLGVPRILTPHVGEMARLTGTGIESIESRRIDAAREWAGVWGAVVVLKGAPTVTAAPDGRATVNPTGNPGMATAGMGDVLTGVIAALVAQGLGTYDAARLGVYAHGLAGDRAAEARGQHGLSAGDVLEAVPHVMLELAKQRDEALENKGRQTRQEWPAA
jgi:NAD(P)H-hydrate epimerase